MKLALTGKMRSGKDTVAEYLKKNYDFRTFAFADGIKFVCGSLSLEPSEGGKPRALYQGVGQDLRKYDQDVWIKYTFRQIDRHCTDDDHIVVTDVRQLNEAEALRAAGFTIISIVSDREKRIERIRAVGDNFKPEDLEHETELAVDIIDVDLEILNNGSRKDLYKTVDFICQVLLDDLFSRNNLIVKNEGADNGQTYRHVLKTKTA